MSTTAEVELTVVLPCLNEERTVGRCVRQAIETCAGSDISAEIVVADNGSADRSCQLAREAGARVIDVPARGYGAALRAGIAAARGRYVAMADSDDSYEMKDIPALVTELRGGADLVMGSRFRGTIEPGAMPFLHRFLGNPVLTFLLNLFFGAGVSDAHCGLRAFSKSAIDRLSLRSSGMEFASEMLIRATQEGLRIREVPTSLRPDGRDRKPHLRTWHDGWRHLRFMLLFSPLWLFLVPGALLGACGFAITIVVAFVPLTILGHKLDTHFAIAGSSLAILGLQLALLGVFAKTIFVLDGIGRSKGAQRLIERFHLERWLLLGLVLFVAGVALDATILVRWIRTHGGALDPNTTHLAILGGTLMAIGVELAFGAFFLSLLKASRTGRWV